MATPLTDSINALTQYANETTGKQDTTLSDAVGSLVDGYGGGSASNVVIGTFQSDVVDQAIDIDIPYTGNGYPLILVICPTGGSFAEGSDFYSLIKRRAVNTVCFVKCDFGLVPSYNFTQDDRDVGTFFGIGKNSTSSPTVYAGSEGISVSMCLDQDATSTSRNNTVRFRSNKKMSVYMMGDEKHGFAQNISYTYYIIYSS
jgi:hypothetical protein